MACETVTPAVHGAQVRSDEVLPEAFLLHSTLPTKKGTLTAQQLTVNPNYVYTSNAPLSFTVPRSSDGMIYPRSATLELELQFRHKDGGDELTADEQLAVPVNGIANSLFRNVETKINGQPVTNMNGMYAYRANMTNRLAMGRAAQKGQLTMEGFEPSDIVFDNLPVDDYKKLRDPADSKSDVLRRRLVTMNTEKKSFIVHTRIHDDIFDQPKALPLNTQLEISLHKTDRKFYTLSRQGDDKTQNMELIIKKAQLSIMILNPDERLRNELRDFHNRGIDAVYPVKMVRMYFNTTATGMADIGASKLITGVLPNMIVIGCVDSDSFHGNVQKDPFNFKDFSAERITVKAHGSQIPDHVIEVDFDKNGGDLYGLISLLTATETLYNPSIDIGIDRENYSVGNVMYGFVINPGRRVHSSYDAFEPCATGSVDVSIKVGKALEQSVTLVMLAQFDGEIRVRTNGTVVATCERRPE